jgi:hypothetical protein
MNILSRRSIDPDHRIHLFGEQFPGTISYLQEKISLVGCRVSNYIDTVGFKPLRPAEGPGRRGCSRHLLLFFLPLPEEQAWQRCKHGDAFFALATDVMGITPAGHNCMDSMFILASTSQISRG